VGLAVVEAGLYAVGVSASFPPFGPTLREQVRENLARHDRHRIELTGRRAAAVAVALVADEEGTASFVLTRRASRLRAHSGQWALPGGRLDTGETAAEAARRELSEEVGLIAPPEEVLGLLDDYATRSGFVITPVVLWGGEENELVANPHEVAAVYRVPLEVLEAPEVPQLRRIPESDRPVISIPMVGAQVHAPTAAIVFQLREVALHGRDTRVAHYEQPTFAWK
jgi:8-oxo-dGTP pyrophosphatase MutT (NUDIX family)